MHLVIAADKFKGSLTSFQACAAMAAGLRQASAHFQITMLPLADGGDGLAEVMAYYTEATKVSVTVSDPLFRPVGTSYLLSQDGQTAIIEMAQASGLLLLRPDEYNPAQTTTFGTGKLICDALQHGVSKIILGIGGSATNDCGIGMAVALGWRFLDATGTELKPIGANLIHVHSIKAPDTDLLKGISVEVACDVTNYLTGDAGAAHIYAPQKGATPEMVVALEKGVQHFASVVQAHFDVDLTTLESGGAAGGLGAGSVFFLHAVLRSGIEMVLQYSGAERYIKAADIVLTGEGKLDVQSLQGKAVHGLATLCKKYNKPLLALCGTLDVAMDDLQANGITAAFSILTKPMLLEAAVTQAEPLLVQAAFNLGNFFKTSYTR